MYENLHNCDNLLDKYGGHKMAAGLSLPVENIDKLRKRLNEQCTLTAEELTEKVTIDMVLPFSEITFDFIEELKMLEPFGKGNTKPVFAERNLKIQRARVLGRERNVLKLHLEDVSKHTMEAIYFGDVEQFFDFLRSKYGNQEVEALLAGSRSNMTIYATYYPEINSYMGRKTLQIVMTHYQ